MSNAGRSPRRGLAIVAVLLILIVVALVVVGAVLMGARHADLSARRSESVRAIAAAEAGMNMAVREMMVSCDEDGDGTVGAISDDGDDTNNPTFGDASVSVTQSRAGATYTLTSTGVAGLARRRITMMGSTTFWYS